MTDHKDARQLLADITASKNLYKGKYRAVLKLLNRVRNKLVHITDHIEDDGDRRYFGSTNDADDLIELFKDMESWIWDALDKHNQMKSDPYADIREQRARADKAEARIKVLEAALKPFANYAARYEGKIGHAVLPAVRETTTSARGIEKIIAVSGLTTQHFFHARAVLPASPHEGTQS